MNLAELEVERQEMLRILAERDAAAWAKIRVAHEAHVKAEQKRLLLETEAAVKENGLCQVIADYLSEDGDVDMEEQISLNLRAIQLTKVVQAFLERERERECQ